ncbi:hypothetical protein, partial [Xanthomonas fragariae]|uniref:hypothetical protein n=1 Tax=Xanthomonas fragariae TaxID=48664 RepID=UPI001EE471B1
MTENCQKPAFSVANTGSSGTPVQTSRPCGRWVVGGFQGRLFKFSTSGQRKIVERAMRNRRRSCVGSRLKTVFNSLKSGVIETLYKNPDLLLDMAKKLRACYELC